MGISKEVFEKTQGYLITRMAEDLEFSIRIEKEGFKMGLIPEAKVYHKRRTSLAQFYKQLFFFGRGRINIFRFYKSELKPMHFFPAVFTLGLVSLPFIKWNDPVLGNVAIGLYLLYSVLLFAGGLFQTNSIKIACLGIAAAFTQLTAYGLGFMKELITYLFGRRKPSGLNR